MADKKKKKVTTTVTEEFVNVPTNEKTQIICILDRSGSMSSIMSDSIGGFNTFLKQQKELKDDATLTVALFDDRYELLYDDINISKVEEITNKIWFPRGTTALYDAIGKTINIVKANHAKLGTEAPSKVLCVIVTDGLENASREYKLNDIKKLIKKCEDDDWNFIYLAANQDAFAVGSSFGVSAGNTFIYTATGVGTAMMFNTVNASATSYRSMSSSDADFKTRSKSLINDDLNNSGDIIINGGTSGTYVTSTYYSTGSANPNDITFTTSNTLK
jgi:uncharacterized protein YegL